MTPGSRNRTAAFRIILMAALAATSAEAMDAQLVDQEPTTTLAAPPETLFRADTMDECQAAVDKSRDLAQTLPDGDLSRYFAERMLQQALTEAGNGEFDDCVEWAEQAALEVTEQRHQLQPGETLDIMKADR